jgi:hypothetical protein
MQKLQLNVDGIHTLFLMEASLQYNVFNPIVFHGSLSNSLTIPTNTLRAVVEVYYGAEGESSKQSFLLLGEWSFCPV